MSAAYATAPDHVRDVLDQLRGVKARGRGWSALCPAHDDSTPSLDIDVGRDGALLLVCRAGCSNVAVLAAANIQPRDLFTPDASHGSGGVAVAYDYTDEAGALLYQKVRLHTAPGEKKQFRQRRPDPVRAGEWIWKLGDVEATLFHLPRVRSAIAAGRLVFVVEGEKDVLTMEHHGFVATTSSEGAKLSGTWTERYSRMLAGATVVVIPDNDEVGWAHVYHETGGILATLPRHAASVRVLHLPDVGEKGDVTDWFEAGGTVEALKALVRQTPVWQGERRVWSDAGAPSTGVTRTTATGVTLTSSAAPADEVITVDALTATQVQGTHALSERDLSGAPRWGWHDLDRLVGAMLPTDVITVGAASGNGKSTFLMSQMDANARNRVETLYFPLEIEPELCRLRWACMHLDLDYAPVVRQEWRLLPEGSREAVRLALDEQTEAPWIQFATPRRATVAAVAKWCRWAVDEFGCRVVMIDHFHRLDFGTGAQYRVAVTEGARHLKDLARELNIVMVLGAQLNRSSDPIDRYMAPTKARLMESSGIEQESDVILMLSRGLQRNLPDKWVQRLRLGTITERDIAEPNAMIVTCRKHRVDDSGLDRRVKLHVSGSRVTDAAQMYRSAQQEKYWYQH